MEGQGKSEKDTKKQQRCEAKLRKVGTIQENYGLISTIMAVVERSNIWTKNTCSLNIILSWFGKNNSSKVLIRNHVFIGWELNEEEIKRPSVENVKTLYLIRKDISVAGAIFNVKRFFFSLFFWWF